MGILELYGIALHFIVTFGIFYYLINGIAWYCIVLYCVVGFGARAVSRKTPIYFIYLSRNRRNGLHDSFDVFKSPLSSLYVPKPLCPNAVLFWVTMKYRHQ